MASPWYELTNFINLQRNLIVDLSGSTNNNALTVVNRIDSSLNELHTAVKTADNSVMSELTKQQQVKEILQREEDRLKERQQAIQDADNQQRRIVDLTGNAIMRNKATNQMYLVLVIALLLFVGVKLISGFMPEIVSDLLVIIIVSGALIMVSYMYYDYTRRNNMNYHEIDLGEPGSMVHKPSTDSSNKNLLDLRLNGCVGEGCCAEGTIFNAKHSICVPKPEGGKAYFIDSHSMQSTVCPQNQGTYSSEELKCVVSQGFTTMTDPIRPYEPTEIVDYTKY